MDSSKSPWICSEIWLKNYSKIRLFTLYKWQNVDHAKHQQYSRKTCWKSAEMYKFCKIVGKVLRN